MSDSYPIITPVYEYTADRPWRYDYQLAPDLRRGWTRQGVAFFAFGKDHPGVAEVHRFVAAKPPRGGWRAAYSTDIHEDFGPGWSREIESGAAFYVFKEQQPNTINVYRFFANNPVRFRYSLEDKAPDGWISQGVAFHVFAAIPSPRVG
jgi:hypothetical protein